MALPQIVWTAPEPKREKNFARLAFHALRRLAFSPSPDIFRLSAAVEQFGVPHVQAATTPKEDVTGLLMLAAEVEHALMVQYLYAAQSVRGVAGRTISHIAVQEMGHLLTVQNLLLSLGGVGPEGMPAGLHLGRDGLRRSSTYNPLPLVLEPVSRSALAKFVVVERPAVILDAALRTRVEALETEVEALGIDPNPVYALYAAIRWIFQADDTPHLTDLGFKPGWHLSDADFADLAAIEPFAAEPVEWGSVPGLIIAAIGGRDDALAAIDAITAQGEGAAGSSESHFSDFLGVLAAFEAGQIAVNALPRTPFTPSQPAPEDLQSTAITNPYTLLWADLFNATYELLLLDIAWSLCQRRGSPGRSQLIDVCIDIMGRLIQPMAGHLSKRPLGAAPLAKAGPPYGLLRESLPTAVAGFASRYQELLVARDGLIQTIRAAGEFASDLPGKLILNSTAEIDLQRAPHLPGGF